MGITSHSHRFFARKQPMKPSEISYNKHTGSAAPAQVYYTIVCTLLLPFHSTGVIEKLKRLLGELESFVKL